MVMANWHLHGDTSPRYYIICMTLDGIPLFSIAEGQLPTLSFPVMGSLNAIHMFAKGNHIELGSTTAEGAKIYWKEYGSIKLIIVNFEITVHLYLVNQLDSLYKCLVMILGAHEFSKITNIEKLKKKMKLCFPLITGFLNSHHLVSNITHLTDTIQVDEPGILQNYINSFAEECQSEFSCLTFNWKVAVGTDKFWHLAPIETTLVLHLLSSVAANATSVDIPIFLPHGSPTVPHRLIAITLIENVHVVLICGPNPSLQTILHKYVKKYWVPVTQTLRSCSRLYPRCLPTDIKLDTNLLGFILINLSDRKTLSSVFPHGPMTGNDQVFLTDSAKRLTSLATFYKTVSNTVFRKNKDSENPVLHDGKETYKCTDKYKCYALQTKHNEIYILFKNDLPTYMLGGITRNVLKQLTKDKSL